MRTDGVRCPRCGRKYGDWVEGVYAATCRCGTHFVLEYRGGLLIREESRVVGEVMLNRGIDKGAPLVLV